jgi:hypothetical protein
MRDGHTQRVCPSCEAVNTVERVTCDHCGTLTVPKVTRAVGSEPHSGTAPPVKTRP